MSLPFRFAVPGVPRSSQAKSTGRRIWQERVRAEATRHWPTDADLIDFEISCVLVLFHTDAVEIDVDNMIKPILDALNLVLIEDDRLISQVTARRTQMEPGLVIQDTTPELLGYIESEPNFVYIELREKPNHGILP